MAIVLPAICVGVFIVFGFIFSLFGRNEPNTLWPVYYNFLENAKYVDLTHAIAPNIPVWYGFKKSNFTPAVNQETGLPFTFDVDGFEATEYHLSTDQLGTQLDPPAHWDPYYPAIDEIPPTYTLRPLVVIPIHEKVKKDFNYQMQVSDILDWESKYGKIPEKSVVFVRSDWSKRWPDPQLSALKEFPGVSLEAIKFLHLNRSILFHGHEPLDTDSTPTLESEYWILHNGYAQAEGVANLDKVPEYGALVSIGFSKFKGGTGSYARYIAICPPDWKYGVTSKEVKEAPMQKMSKPLNWTANGIRERN